MQALVLCMALTSAAPAALAQTSVMGSATAPTEERVKAAFLLRFISYVEWPATAFAKPDSPYVVGILHDEDTADELVALAAGRLANNRAVIVKRLQASDSFNGLHVLFIGGAESSRLAQWLKSLQQQPILLVTAAEGSLTQGSMINFRIVEDRVRFEIALTPAERAGLKFNSRLLGVALSVIKGPQ
jgi:hypothetical protein